MTDLEKKVLDRYRDFRIALEELYFYNFATRNVATAETNGLMSAADKVKLDRLDQIVADLQIQAGGSSSYALQADLMTLRSAMSDEVIERSAAVLSLQNQINSEIADRATADTQIYNQLQSSLSSLEMEFYGALSGLEVELPIAGASTLGCICVGDGLVMSGDTLSVDHNQFAHRITRFNLASTAWTQDTSATSDYAYYADIPVTALTVADYVVVDFDLTAQAAALDANVSYTAQSFDGYVRLFAEAQPSAALTGQITIWKG